MSDPVIYAIGDSHTEYFSLKSPWLQQRLGVDDEASYKIEANAIQGASLSGIRKYASTLKAREVIEDLLKKKPEYLVLNFGQVDLELSYYHKIVIKGEDWNPTDYVSNLSEVYFNFLSAVDLGDTKLAVKGVNLTVLSLPQFALGYTSRIITDKTLSGDKSEHDLKAAKSKLKENLLTEQQQNAMHMDFNTRVADICKKLGHAYFDINDYLAARTKRGKIIEPRKLSIDHQPAKFDHHVVSSIGVVRAHYRAAGKAFGLL